MIDVLTAEELEELRCSGDTAELEVKLVSILEKERLIYKKQGKKEGRIEGTRETLIKQLKKKFGFEVINEKMIEKIYKLEYKELDYLVENIFDITIEELESKIK